MALDKILDHSDAAVDRLVQQYKEKPKLEALLRSYTDQVQDLETAFCEVFTDRALDVAIGNQLDLFGTIVNRSRDGFNDEFYRILLRVQIGINTSQGVPEDIISTLKLLLSAGLVHYQNAGNGNILLAADVLTLPASVQFVYDNMQKVVMAGVRITQIICFDPDEPFSFDGVGPVGLGFSSLAAPLTGGKFAFIHQQTTPFAFAGSDSALGFGTIADPLVGGVFVGL